MFQEWASSLKWTEGKVRILLDGVKVFDPSKAGWAPPTSGCQGTGSATRAQNQKDSQRRVSDSFEISPGGFEISGWTLKMCPIIFKVLIRISELENDAELSKSQSGVICQV